MKETESKIVPRNPIRFWLRYWARKLGVPIPYRSKEELWDQYVIFIKK